MVGEASNDFELDAHCAKDRGERAYTHIDLLNDFRGLASVDPENFRELLPGDFQSLS
jgi:hypothetical protein